MLSNHGANVRQLCIKYGVENSDIVDFSSNINIFKPNINYDCLTENIRKNIDKYPDIEYEELKYNISKIYQVDEQYIYSGNGATEVIYDIISLDEFKNIGIFNPTFSEYERACKIYKKNIIQLDINKINLIKKDMSIKEFQKSISLYLPDIMILCNPNNPTGEIEDLSEILDFCQKNNIFLFVDETFIDFMYNEKFSLKSRVKNYDKLIVLNAITKFFAMTAARLGYAFCSNKYIIESLEDRKKPWSINLLAEEIIKQISVSNGSFYNKTKEYFSSEKDRLYKEYSKNNINITNSSAPFFCIEIKNSVDAIELQKKLLKEKSFLVRVLRGYKNISNNNIRVAIKDEKNNDKLLNALLEFYKSKN